MNLERVLGSMVALGCLVLPAAAHGGGWANPFNPPPAGGHPPPPTRGAPGTHPGGAVTGPTTPSGPTDSPGAARRPGPATPGAGAPGAGGFVQAGAVTPNAGFDADPTLWSTWWDLNKAPYLALEEHIRATPLETGRDGGLEDGRAAPARVDPEPVVRALLDVLEGSSNNDLVTGALIALAKIGAGPDGGDPRRYELALVPFLADANQEIRETAAVSLGILASPRTIPTLAHLLWDTEEGRALVERHEVDDRTRAFAAYGLGLVAARADGGVERPIVVAALRRALETEATRTRDVAVACVNALSIVPLAAAEPRDGESERSDPPESSCQAQLAYLLELLRDRERHFLVRAQCPVALTRLLTSLPAAEREPFRVRIADELLGIVDREREAVELVQSAVLALGQLGTNDGECALDRRIRAALRAALRGLSQPQSRGFVLIALAQSAARTGSDPARGGLGDSAEFLLEQLSDGKSGVRPWAGLACGLLGHELARTGVAATVLDRLRRGVRATLAEERDPSNLAAYATAAGLLGDLESAPLLARKLADDVQDDARGRVAVALGLMQHRDASASLRKIVADATYRPILIRECAVGLALLEDAQAVPLLAGMLASAKSLAAQASISTALGSIGDGRAIAPLLAALHSTSATERARAFAAVGLGNVVDERMLPWNTEFALGTNYRAATPTLSEPVSATGILDIL